MVDLKTPILRNDEQTLEERMNYNGYHNVLPARYMSKDESGNIIESQEDVFARVAKNVSVAEALHVHDRPDYIPLDLLHDHFSFEDYSEYVEGDEIQFSEDTACFVSYDKLKEYLFDDYIHAHDQMVEWKEEFEEIISHLDMMPNTPTLINAGNELQQLSACFVLDIDDDMRDIHEVGADAAEIFQAGGGLGYPFSFLRPYGDQVGSTGGVASGPISFMQTLDQICSTIAQGGIRRGAQMGVMHVWHPDIPFFLHSKRKDVSLAQTLLLNDPDDPTHNSFSDALEEARDIIDEEGRVPSYLRNAVEGHLSNFNISVAVTDEFMDCLHNGEEFTLKNPRTDEVHIANEKTKELWSWFGLGEYVEVGEELSVPAEVLWEKLIEGAHENGEPGVIYIDRVNKHNSFDVEKHPEYCVNATNPCVTEGTLVNTPFGPEKVENIKEDDLINTVWGFESVDEVKTYTDQDIYRVEFSDGGEMEVTENHRFHVKNKDKSISDIPLKNIKEGDVIRVHTNELENSGSDEDYKHWLKRGILLGDGGYTEKTLDRGNVLTISTNEDDIAYNENLKKLFIESRFNADDSSKNDKALKLNISEGKELIEELNLTPEKSIDKNFDVTEIQNEAQAMGILDGLLATDGNVNNRNHFPQIRWFTSSYNLAQSIRDTLISIGFHGRISVDNRKNRGGKIDGRQIKENAPKYTISISGNSLLKYCEKSHLRDLHPSKGDQMQDMMKSKMLTGNTFKAKIENIEYIGKAEVVYDLYCEGSDTWITHGYVQRGCGEEPLFDGDACNLNHINLSTIVSEDVTPWIDYNGSVEDFLDQAIDWEELERRVEIGTRFLDNVVTMSNFPVEKIHNTVKENRKIGLGIMGLAQLMIQVGIEYGSEESQKLSEEVMKFIHHQSKHVSNELAYQRGAFENFDDSKWSDINSYPEWFEHHAGFPPEEHEHNDFLQRNHETTTVAPTGTTSILANTSGGCEPIFNVVYFKNVTDDVQGDEMMVEFDNLFLKTLEENDIDVEKVKEEAIELMNNNEYEKPSDIPSVPDDLGDLFVTTNELSSKQHASVQCAIQKGCGSGISKTVNAPNDATIEDAKLAFEYIYDNGGKSVTYYRDGSRTKQVNTVRKDNQEVESEESEPTEEKVSNPLSRSAPKVASGVRYEINTGYGDMFVNIVEDEHGPVELIANVGKSGGTVQSMTEAIGRLVSKSLQNGVNPEDIINQLENIHSPKKSWDGGEGIESIPDGIATALRRYGDDMNHKTVKPTNFDEVQKKEQKSGNDGDECLECGAMAVRYDGGCPVCESCGWSKC